MVVLGLNAWAAFTNLLVGLLVARPGDALLDGVECSAGAGCASVYHAGWRREPDDVEEVVKLLMERDG
jgi:hypothetical protein